jgi:hypothetical protein
MFHKGTKTFFHPSVLQSLPNNPRECDTTTPTRPSSDFSSVEPSQSASQVTLNRDQEEPPLSEPVGIHAVMNAAEPISPSVATTMTVAAALPAPAKSNTSCHRPPSGNNYDSMFNTLQCHYTSHLRVRNRTSYATPCRRVRCRRR